MYVKYHTRTLTVVSTPHNSPTVETQITVDQTNEMWYIHTLEYDGAMKRNGILTLAALTSEHTKRKKPGTKDHILCDTISMRCSNQIKSRSVVPTGEEEKDGSDR